MFKFALLIVIVDIPVSIVLPAPVVVFASVTVTPLPLKFIVVIDPAKPVAVTPCSCTEIPSTAPDAEPDPSAQNLLPFTSPCNTKSLLPGKPKLGSASSRLRKDGNPFVCCLSVDSPE